MTLVEWIIAVSGFLGALAVIGGVGKYIWQSLRRMGHVADDLLGEPARPGVPERPGVMDRLANMDAELTNVGTRLVAVEAQLQPNGGATLRDAVIRTEKRVGALDNRVTEMQADQAMRMNNDEWSVQVSEGTSVIKHSNR